MRCRVEEQVQVPHQAAQELLRRGGEVILLPHLHPRLPQHLHRLGGREGRGRLRRMRLRKRWRRMRRRGGG